MATIRKLPSGKWNVQIRRGGKLITSSTHPSQKDAQTWAEREERLMDQDHPLFIDAGYAYCHEVLAGKASQSLALNRIDRISRSESMKKPLNEITLQDINAFKQARLGDVATTTCRDELMMIRRVYRWYISENFAETGKMLENPCDLLTLPRSSKPRDRVVSRDELALLLSAMTPRMAVVVELAYETAMRRGELLKITPLDLHLESQFLRVVDGKEGSRDVPLTRRAVELLEAASSDIGMRSARIFPMASYSVTQAVRRARIEVGLDDNVRFHQLRHSRITEVARMGLNQLQIMMVSGHRDIRSVQRYTHLNVRDVVDLLD